MSGSGTGRRVWLALAGVALSAQALYAIAQEPSPPAVAAAQTAGKTLYDSRCAACHEHAQARIPPRSELQKKSADAVALTLTSGSMRLQASGLGAPEIADLAAYLSGNLPRAHLSAAPEQNPCATPAPPIVLAAGDWNGWGLDAANSRFQRKPGLAAGDVPRLKVKWAFGYHDVGVYGQPNVIAGRVFISSMTGRVYALDAASGCVYWTYDAEAPARTAISIDALPGPPPTRYAAIFGDDGAHVYALDARTGALIWKRRLDPHPSARVTAAPALHAHRLYVPLSSLEELSALDPKYECCKFRGSVVALDEATGQVLWRRYLTATPRPYRKSSLGTQLYGPAGVSSWHTPLVDAKRGLLYAVTGNSYTTQPAPLSDALIALDLASGAVKWVQQVAHEDNYVVGCVTPPDQTCPYGPSCAKAGEANCPARMGPDHDFGGAPILRTLPDGRELILAATKAGAVYAFDPDHAGRILWQAQSGQGSDVGGSEWGPAADEGQLYVAVSDVHPRPGHSPGGLTAYDLASGAVRWHTDPPPAQCSWGSERCSSAQSQALSVIPGVVFSGSQDGHLRAYASADGRIIWDVDTAQAFTTVNGVSASGGSLDHAGPVIAQGRLFVNSGYGKITGHTGNVLIAFSIDGH
ncbi:MAG TPA: PQQ-binding-like beta-propeller repeat protein [Steroidobacteraceae bacterium]|nr:PQQ-binding-like beta-propeller repeat protein [Steroidobacteraceae bacterium]